MHFHFIAFNRDLFSLNIELFLQDVPLLKKKISLYNALACVYDPWCKNGIDQIFMHIQLIKICSY